MGRCDRITASTVSAATTEALSEETVRARALFLLALPIVLAAAPGTATPPELVATYERMADAILACDRAEEDLVRSILAMTYRHGEGAVAKAKTKLEARQNAREQIEQVATLVPQLANERDASVAATRKRLVEGGHHHNAEGERQGIFDEGFVVVTRSAKKNFLDSASRLGKLAQAPDAAVLDAEWGKVA